MEKNKRDFEGHGAGGLSGRCLKLWGITFRKRGGIKSRTYKRPIFNSAGAFTHISHSWECKRRKSTLEQF